MRDIEEELYTTQLEENAIRRRIQNNGSTLGSLANGHGVRSDLQQRLEEIERDKRELGAWRYNFL